jgi:hypothetical protein
MRVEFYKMTHGSKSGAQKENLVQRKNYRSHDLFFG